MPISRISPKVIFWGRMPASKRCRHERANYRLLGLEGCELLLVAGVENAALGDGYQRETANLPAATESGRGWTVATRAVRRSSRRALARPLAVRSSATLCEMSGWLWWVG
jgi:hypothetical protein